MAAASQEEWSPAFESSVSAPEPTSQNSIPVRYSVLSAPLRGRARLPRLGPHRAGAIRLGQPPRAVAEGARPLLGDGRGVKGQAVRLAALGIVRPKLRVGKAHAPRECCAKRAPLLCSNTISSWRRTLPEAHDASGFGRAEVRPKRAQRIGTLSKSMSSSYFRSKTAAFVRSGQIAASSRK